MFFFQVIIKLQLNFSNGKLSFYSFKISVTHNENIMSSDASHRVSQIN